MLGAFSVNQAGTEEPQPFLPSPPPTEGLLLAFPVMIVSFSFQSDRLVPELDTIVPLESTKAYDMLDIVHSVSVPPSHPSGLLALL